MKITFRLDKINGGIDAYNLNLQHLGKIDWWEQWECYSWMQREGIVMGIEGLEQIITKLKELNDRK